MDTKYKTRELSTTDANSTVTIRPVGTTKTPAELGYVNIIKDSAHVVTFYDGDPAAGGEVIFTKLASSGPGYFPFARPVLKGLYAVVAASFAGCLVVGYN